MKTLCLSFLFLFSFLHISAVNAAQAIVQGQLIARNNNYPAPGLTVSLVHPRLGRSAPAISDGNGTFTFYEIPIMPTQYFIEVYWGGRLIFRNAIFVNNFREWLPIIYI